MCQYCRPLSGINCPCCSVSIKTLTRITSIYIATVSLLYIAYYTFEYSQNPTGFGFSYLLMIFPGLLMCFLEGLVYYGATTEKPRWFIPWILISQPVAVACVFYIEDVIYHSCLFNHYWTIIIVTSLCTVLIPSPFIWWIVVSSYRIMTKANDLHHIEGEDCPECLLVEIGEQTGYLNEPCKACGKLARVPQLSQNFGLKPKGMETLSCTNSNLQQ